MHAKRRNHRIQLYRSIYVRKGQQGNTHGYAEQQFVGSLPANATELPTELAIKLSDEEKAESFGALMTALMAHARGDVCRSRLVSEILSVGTARVAGDNPALIIPPWHPERMKALAVKSRRVAGFATHLLSSKNILYGDREIFMRELSDEIAHPFYPEIAVLVD